ncbi:MULTISPECIES: hypothetical protein [Streptomyces]|uniref:ATP-binding protein n=1 Tax=Streptomyces dengpaensis TaxID=2049881 RepID=A0ABN5IBL3_9ACTN|nr:MULTISPECIES: hypothetical protein [Streptomyces]AVH60556.1 hypothetical protein C4B68_37670 [Streptomyces dengpaensis]PIB04465.1 hypothetical protein B1C81_33265 [Streptomyces sp. HG99]
MILHQALTQCRTLVVEGPDGIGRSGLIAELTRHGFMIRRSRGHLHHVNPTQPYRELLATPGRLAIDGSLVHELVYGPLRRGRSRVTWIQALDFAEAVAERGGALIHVTGEADDTEAVDAYERAVRTLAQHVPVVTFDRAEPGRPIRAPTPHQPQHGALTRTLTIG